MPRTPEQYEEIRREKRSLIMDTALVLFAENGYRATTMSQIADRADISKGLIYNYFDNKEELMVQIFHKGIDELFQPFDPNHDGFLTDQEFDYFIDKSLELITENPSFWRLYFTIMFQPQVLVLVQEKIIENILPFMDILSDFFDRKKLPNPMAEARLFGALLDGVAINYLADPGNFPIKELAEIIKQRYKLVLN